MSVIHDVSRAIHILRLLRSGTIYLCFFFKILFNDEALGDQKYISLMK